jgi:sarcosine oxidase subunit beta
MHVIIVGGGLEGLAVAWALSRRGGHDITVLERERICSGGTVKSSGIVRCHYGVPSLAKMAWIGLRTFEDAQTIFGEEIGFFQTGYVVGVGPGDEAALRANVELQRSLGVETRIATCDEVQELWPYADLSRFTVFAYEPRGGYGDAYQTGRAFAKSAIAAGVVVRENTPVVEVVRNGSGNVLGVRTQSGERCFADAVVLAAGPWSVELAAPLGIELPIKAQREQILFIDAGEPIVDAPVFSDIVNLQYIRTERSGQLLVGNSDHSSPEYADPDDYLDRADDAYVEHAIEKIDRLLPRLPNPALAYSYAGCYDVTPDFNPIIGPLPLDGLYLCAGFSGHGFKISPAVGELVADILCDGRSRDPDIDAADFSFERYANGRPLVSRNPYRRAGQMR